MKRSATIFTNELQMVDVVGYSGVMDIRRTLAGVSVFIEIPFMSEVEACKAMAHIKAGRRGLP